MKRVRTILFTAALAKTKARNLGLIALCIVGLSMTTVVSADLVYVVDRSTTTGDMVSLEGTIEVSMLGDLTIADFVDWSLTLTSTTGLLPIEMTPSNSVWGQRSDLLITATESTLTITIASKTTFPGDPDGNIFNAMTLVTTATADRNFWRIYGSNYWFYSEGDGQERIGHSPIDSEDGKQQGNVQTPPYPDDITFMFPADSFGALVAGFEDDPPTFGGVPISTVPGEDMGGPSAQANSGRCDAFANGLRNVQNLIGLDDIAGACEELEALEYKGILRQNAWFNDPLATEIQMTLNAIQDDLGCL